MKLRGPDAADISEREARIMFMELGGERDVVPVAEIVDSVMKMISKYCPLPATEIHPNGISGYTV